jgi:hypothetical protein
MFQEGHGIGSPVRTNRDGEQEIQEQQNLLATSLYLFTCINILLLLHLLLLLTCFRSRHWGTANIHICTSVQYWAGWSRGNAMGSFSDRISARMRAILTEILRGFPQSLHANAGIICELGHDRFLPHPFQFSISLSTHRSMLQCVSTDCNRSRIAVGPDDDGVGL